jgi:hypothetical protein
MLLLPLPGMLEELLTCKIILLDTFGSKLLNDLVLCGDGSMVCTRHPASILAIHSCLTDKHVIQCIVQYMSHMKDTGHVWWWNHYSIRFSFVWFRMKKLVF